MSSPRGMCGLTILRAGDDYLIVRAARNAHFAKVLHRQPASSPPKRPEPIAGWAVTR